MSILITGAAGFIGFHLARRLLECGEAVIGFDNLNDYYDVSLKHARIDILRSYRQFTFIRGDLANKQDVDSLFCTYAPHMVFHLAAQAGVRYSIQNPQVYIDSNITGFFNILEACRSYGQKRLIYASSSSVYGNQKKTPFSETDNVDEPISLYAATKKANELMAYTYSHLYGIQSAGLRFFTVYGEYGRPDMAYFHFAKRILRGDPIQVFNDGNLYRDFTYIDDIIDGIFALYRNQPVNYKIYNLGNNKPVKLLVFIQTLEAALGVTAKIEFLPMQAGDVYQTYANIAAAQNDFGFTPKTDISSGLGRFAQWYKKHYHHIATQ